MKLKNRSPLGVEALEDRWVPATVRFDGSNLFVSNPLITAGKSSLSVIETGANQFQVKDGAANNGFYAVSGNITINGNNASDQFEVLVNGSGLTGNLNVTTGNGPSSVTVDGSVAGASFVAGNTTINMGNGADSVWIASKQPAGGIFSGASTGMTEKGNLTLNARGLGANLAIVAPSPAAPSSVLGSVAINNFPTAILGAAGNVFAGGIIVNNSANSSPSKVTLGGADLGNFQLNGGQGATSVALNNNVSGTASLQLANGNNSVTLAGGAAGISLGNLNVNAGNGNNSITLGNAANTVIATGNVNLNLGNGANAFGVSTGLTVNGNLFLRTGNGSLDVGTKAFEGNVFGSLGVNTGNGNNSFTLDGAGTANVGGSWTYTGGNGGNAVTVTTQATDLFTLNVGFGNNPGSGAGTSNVFTIGTGVGAGFVNGTLTGAVSWGIPSLTAAGNAFVDNGYVWMNNITLTNIPS
jgi:hypothetical protein